MRTFRVRRIDEDILKCVPVQLPRPDKPREIDRHLLREEHANWKIVCECGAILYFNTMDIGKVNDRVQYWHPKHVKAVYSRMGMQLSYRGRIPAMETPG